MQEAGVALRDDWGITLPELLSEDALLELLAQRVMKLIAQGPEPFFQAMYRLDIPEKKLNAVMHDELAAEKIARLIYDRQLQKIQSRMNNKATRHDADPDLRW